MSGVILATAIGSGVAAAGGTAAVVAAGIGAGTTIYGGAKSFSDASKARKRGEAAQRAADKAIEEAKKRVDVNVYEQLSIAKEPYELMREAQLVQGATGLQAAVEGSSRGAAATAGRIQMAQGQQQAAIRAQQAQQVDALNKLVADEDARRQQQLAGIAMDEAAGAQLAVRDAEEDRANYIAQGVGTLGSIAEGLSSSYAEGNFGQANTRRQQRLAEEARLNEVQQGVQAASRRNAALRPVTMGGVDAEGYEIPLDDEGPRNAFPVTGTPAAGLGQISTGEFVAPQIPGTTQAQPMITGPGGYNMAPFGLLPSQEGTGGPLANPRGAVAPQPLVPRGVGTTVAPTARLRGEPQRVSPPFFPGEFFNAAGSNQQDALNNLAAKLKAQAGLTDAQVDVALRRAKIERDGSASFMMPPSELFLDYFSQ